MVKGLFADVDVAQITRLVSQYHCPRTVREQDYLPLAQQILGRNGNQMAPLGLSLACGTRTRRRSGSTSDRFF